METILTSSQDQSGITTKWWRNYPEQTTEQEQEKSLKTLYTWKNKLQHNLPTSAQQKTRGSGQTDPQSTRWREGPNKERPNNNQNPNISREPTQMTSQEQQVQEIKETAVLNLTGPLPL